MHQNEMTQAQGSNAPVVEKCVRDLVMAADGTSGLDLLLLLAQDPLVCDTAVGFSARLHRPLADVRHSLESLRACGVLESSAGPGGPDNSSYWLPTDPHLFGALGRLWRAYSTTPKQRREVLALVTAPASVAD